ncbi:MAG: hypothetical protein WCS54_06145 [Fibrobacteraceae bacterium]
MKMLTSRQNVPDASWTQVVTLCESIGNVTYENLTKIIRYAEAGSATGARHLDAASEDGIDAWMGGGTCYSLTWHLYQKLRTMGFAPRLLLGDKRKEKGVHSALRLNYEGREYFFDPGYMIFDPMALPAVPTAGTGEVLFPFVPNFVRIAFDGVVISLFTGSAGQQLKLRFEFSFAGVDEAGYLESWSKSFEREMMTYPVLNRLDREKGVQYYYQKGNLVRRDAKGSSLTRIPEENRIAVLSEIFKIDPGTIERALGILASRSLPPAKTF